MTAPPTPLDALTPSNWATLVLVSGRVSGLMLTAPFWSMRSVPAAVRGALMMVLSLALLPTVTPTPLSAEPFVMLLPLLSELVMGVAIGFVGAVFTAGIALAGEVISMQMGLNMAEALMPGADTGSTGLGEMQSMLTLVIYVTLGGHLLLLGGLAQSFGSVPPGGALAMREGGAAVMALASSIFVTAARAAAPVMAAVLLANVGLGILSKAVPQLNAMAVGFPITISLGLILLGASLPFFGRFVGDWTNTLGGGSLQMIRAFTPAGP